MLYRVFVIKYHGDIFSGRPTFGGLSPLARRSRPPAAAGYLAKYAFRPRLVPSRIDRDLFGDETRSLRTLSGGEHCAVTKELTEPITREISP